MIKQSLAKHHAQSVKGAVKTAYRTKNTLVSKLYVSLRAWLKVMTGGQVSS